MSMEDDFIEFENSVPKANSLTETEVSGKDFYRKLGKAYSAFVTGRAEKADVLTVMDDLTKFCRLYDTTVPAFGATPAWPQEVLEGRRQVILRVLEFSRLSPDELFNRYHKQG